MATITRTEEMFAVSTETSSPASFWDSVCRAINRLLLPDWVIRFAEEKAAEIKRQQFYHS